MIFICSNATRRPGRLGSKYRKIYQNLVSSRIWERVSGLRDDDDGVTEEMSQVVPKGIHTTSRDTPSRLRSRP